jgi:Glycosyl hydrolase family 26
LIPTPFTRRKDDEGDATVSADNELTRRGRRSRLRETRESARRRRVKLVTAIAAISAAVAIAVSFGLHVLGPSAQPVDPPQRQGNSALPTAPGSYLGLAAKGVPQSYAGVTTFTTTTGVKPNLVTYYSGWLEPFNAQFAKTAASHGAVPLVQIDPTNVSLAAIAAGQYDSYLTTYAEDVKAHRRPVILGFGHEMNGTWYSWGYRHTSPATFVAAWRHIVDLFRLRGVRNVSWLWTINVIHPHHNSALPGQWWPGSSYVTWVGIDGYYYSPSYTFASLFGPTITAVRALTHDPILISETAVASSGAEPAKIADLFAGIRLYALLGFVWFDSDHIEDWRLSGPRAIAAFRLGAKTYYRPA